MNPEEWIRFLKTERFSDNIKQIKTDTESGVGGKRHE